jgi:hypothetical protein
MQQIYHNVPDTSHQSSAQFSIAQLILGLRLKYRLFQADGNCPQNAFTDIISAELALIKLVNVFKYPLTKCTEVSAAVRGILTVNKGVILLAETVGVSESKIQRLIAIMQRRIDFFEQAFFFDQVK